MQPLWFPILVPPLPLFDFPMLGFLSLDVENVTKLLGIIKNIAGRLPDDIREIDRSDPLVKNTINKKEKKVRLKIELLNSKSIRIFK